MNCSSTALCWLLLDRVAIYGHMGMLGGLVAYKALSSGGLSGNILLLLLALACALDNAEKTWPWPGRNADSPPRASSSISLPVDTGTTRVRKAARPRRQDRALTAARSQSGSLVQSNPAFATRRPDTICAFTPSHPSTQQAVTHHTSSFAIASVTHSPVRMTPGSADASQRSSLTEDMDPMHSSLYHVLFHDSATIYTGHGTDHYGSYFLFRMSQNQSRAATERERERERDQASLPDHSSVLPPALLPRHIAD